jgi:hypothetical protein
MESALEAVAAKWKDRGPIRAIASEMAALEDRFLEVRYANSPEESKTRREAWARLSSLFFDLAWEIVDAKLDEKALPDRLAFDPEERLLIDCGFLSEKTSPSNEHLEALVGQTASVDIYQYLTLSESVAAEYALYFDKPYQGPEGNRTFEEKIRALNDEMNALVQRRRIMLSLVLGRCGFLTAEDVERMLGNLERCLASFTEVELRTRRVRDAETAERERMQEEHKLYFFADKDLRTALARATNEVEGFTDAEEDKILGLHDRSRFLASLIVHVGNEAERWRTRTELARTKHKKKGFPARKMELRDIFNRKKEFMLLAARTARLDTSPLCAWPTAPLSFRSASEILMDLTPLDPEMLRASRVRMYGIPRVVLTPGQGLGVYDWTDNTLIVPVFAPNRTEAKSLTHALGSFRWDNDEDRALKDTYALLKDNEGKGIRALQESFCGDYFIWLTKERKGYRVLPRDTAKWFRAHFKPVAVG